MQRESITGNKLKKVTEMIKDKSKVHDAFAEFYYSKNGASHKANGENDIKHVYALFTDKQKKNMGIGLLNPVAVRLRAKLEKSRK
jgi:hypothetical protein